ncbi:hypothetical protein NDU88_011888 [Pleurodeles waltl]|uniref:Uncharacterized protein n=1 Tax=Pleurodeles waltl TaxID=8319 RepID=A0AAV7S686_PLEWA|nr:hypothetical protein NDU88_011888 [Pleurodeles waltl]
MGGGFRRQEHSREEYYRQGKRRRNHEAGAQQEGVLQPRAQEEDSGGRSTVGRSTTDKGTGGGLRRQELSRRECYRQGHRRRTQEAGSQLEGVLQTRAHEEDSGVRSTAGGSATEKGTGGGLGRQELSRREYDRQGHRRRTQEAAAQLEGVLQTRAQEEDSGRRSTARGSTTDKGTGGGFSRQKHSKRGSYKEGHRRTIQGIGAQQGGVLQTGAQEEDSEGRSTAGGSTTDRGTGGGSKRQEHSREEYYRQRHRRRIQKAGAQQGGVLQTRAQEEDSGGRSTARRSTTDKGTGGGLRRREHRTEEYYRQGHRRRTQEAGAQHRGVLQIGDEEEDSGGRSTAGRSTTEEGHRKTFRKQEQSRKKYYIQGHKRWIQEAGALHGGVLQTRVQEEDSGGRCTAGGSTIDKGTEGGFQMQEHSRREYYRQGHRRRIQEAGAQ